MAADWFTTSAIRSISCEPHYRPPGCHPPTTHRHGWKSGWRPEHWSTDCSIPERISSIAAAMVDAGGALLLAAAIDVRGRSGELRGRLEHLAGAMVHVLESAARKALTMSFRLSPTSFSSSRVPRSTQTFKSPVASVRAFSDQTLDAADGRVKEADRDT
jgi:hypothetical protein